MASSYLLIEGAREGLYHLVSLTNMFLFYVAGVSNHKTILHNIEVDLINLQCYLVDRETDTFFYCS